MLEAIQLNGKVKPVVNALNRDEILEKVLDSPLTKPEKALVCLLYLTGARASEVIEISANDFEGKPIPGTNEIALTVKVNTRKNRTQKQRVNVIPLNHTIEKEMFNIVNEFVATRIAEEHKTDCLIFPVSRIDVFRVTNKIKIKVLTRYLDGSKTITEWAVNPHYFRHCRATHLVNDYHFDVIELMRFMGWSNTEPAKIYVRKDWLSQATKFNAVKDEYDKKEEPKSESITSKNLV